MHQPIGVTILHVVPKGVVNMDGMMINMNVKVT